MIATTIEQSKQLLKLGLPRETADMRHSCGIVSKQSPMVVSKLIIGPPQFREDISAWSVGRLMEMLPQSINNHFINIFKTEHYEWTIEYITLKGEYDCDCEFKGKTLCEAAFKAVVWCLQQKVKLNVEDLK